MQADRRVTQVIGVVDVGQPGDLRACDVLETHKASGSTRLEDDVVEIGRLFQSTLEDQVWLKRLRRHRRLGDHPAGHLGVLRTHGGDDLCRRQVEGRHTLWIEPDAH
ncbi:hypothetical protein D3C86_1817460 [compost metagenome]